MEVIATAQFIEWYNEIDEQMAEDVTVAVDLLEIRGVTLGYPQSSKIEDTDINLRELRIQSGGRPVRVFYSFDPARDAVVLIGGDKTGDNRFYERMVPVAEAIWSEYLQENFGDDED